MVFGVDLIEEAGEVVDPTQSASAPTETLLGFNRLSNLSDGFGVLTGNGGDGADSSDSPMGLGQLVTPRNVLILVLAYLVVTRTGIGESIGDVVTGGS